MPANNLTAERLRELLDYDPESGIFRWRVRGRGIRPGKAVGCNTRGYIAIRIDGTLYLAHRLAWLYVYGTWPGDNLDHIDRNKANNRIANLRDASKSINMQNVSRARADSKTGVLGVSWHAGRGKFVAHLSVNGVYVLNKHFRTLEEAEAAYNTAKRLHHPGFHHGATYPAQPRAPPWYPSRTRDTLHQRKPSCCPRADCCPRRP